MPKEWFSMDIKKALEITRDRIENLKSFTPRNISEERIAKETLEYLEFIEKLLEKEINEWVIKSIGV